MDRYYSTLKNLPSELLISNDPNLQLEDLKISRWLTRDTFLQMSLEPFAAANGIGPDHLQNFLYLQDAIIVKLLIQRLDVKTLEICGLLQLIFTESPQLIEFLFSAPNYDTSVLKVLIENCPLLFNLINLFKDFKSKIYYNQDKFYYWNTIAILIRKYPIQATLDLAKEVIKEIQTEIEHGHDKSDKNLLYTDLIKEIVEIFPFLEESDVSKVLKTTAKVT